MELIDKANVMAEIERLKTIYNDDENIHHVAKYNVLVEILWFLDTLEVKEVDLDKKIREYLYTYWSKEKELNPFLGHIAKQFFELGLKAARKEE